MHKNNEILPDVQDQSMSSNSNSSNKRKFSELLPPSDDLLFPKTTVEPETKKSKKDNWPLMSSPRVNSSNISKPHTALLKKMKFFHTDIKAQNQQFDYFATKIGTAKALFAVDQEAGHENLKALMLAIDKYSSLTDDQKNIQVRSIMSYPTQYFCEQIVASASDKNLYLNLCDKAYREAIRPLTYTDLSDHLRVLAAFVALENLDRLGVVRQSVSNQIAVTLGEIIPQQETVDLVGGRSPGSIV